MVSWNDWKPLRDGTYERVIDVQIGNGESLPALIFAYETTDQERGIGYGMGMTAFYSDRELINARHFPGEPCLDIHGDTRKLGFLRAQREAIFSSDTLPQSLRLGLLNLLEAPLEEPVDPNQN